MKTRVSICTGFALASLCAGAIAADYYTYYAGSPGMLTTLGEGALGHIKNVSVYNPNPSDERGLR